MLIFGYTALAPRVLTLLAALVTFLLAVPTFKKMFGEAALPFMLALLFFNPIYLTYQRLGWAITLLPLFTVLILYFAVSNRRWKWLWVGLVAGLGMETHVLFLPTLAGIIVGAAIYAIGRFRFWLATKEALGRGVIVLLLALIGFWAGFSTQFAVMRLWTEDQGQSNQVARLLADRIIDMKDIFPLYVSGSAFVARYLGQLWSGWVTAVVAFLIGVMALAAVINKKTWRLGLAILSAAGVNILLMLSLVPQYSPRYFVMFVLIFWLLAGVGMANLASWMKVSIRWQRWLGVGAALVLAAVFVVGVVLPFKKTGGSTAEFALVHYHENAYSLVDPRPLVECVGGIGGVSSESPHILNMLQYISHEHDDIKVVSEERISQAEWLAHYRKEGEGVTADEACPELEYFRVLPAD
ncbi:MAG: glycosyltransferase family 39 protein [Candidatus Andersenbacteria bacterium]|nr:glycosyltransferase family 39 protein [bacterium]MDZ4225694.1 glycosyltransferase family 39 protein [Candidatus Andersenbacteria bacterium]